MKKTTALLILIAMCIVSCRKDPVKEALTSLQSHPITMHLDRMECRMLDRDTTYADRVSPVLRLVTYVDSSECSPCTLNNLYTWNDYLDEARQYKGKLKYIFIFAPKPGKYNLEDVHLSIESCGVKCPVYVDTAYTFIHDNPTLPRDRRYHTLLLNSKDSVLMVGSPMNNTQIEEIFKRIVKSANL